MQGAPSQPLEMGWDRPALAMWEQLRRRARSRVLATRLPLALLGTAALYGLYSVGQPFAQEIASGTFVIGRGLIGIAAMAFLYVPAAAWWIGQVPIVGLPLLFAPIAIAALTARGAIDQQTREDIRSVLYGTDDPVLLRSTLLLDGEPPLLPDLSDFAWYSLLTRLLRLAERHGYSPPVTANLTRYYGMAVRHYRERRPGRPLEPWEATTLARIGEIAREGSATAPALVHALEDHARQMARDGWAEWAGYRTCTRELVAQLWTSRPASPPRPGGR